MSDFMPWLYANYIRPQIDAADKGSLEFDFDLLCNDLPPTTRPSLDRVLAFTAIQAFALGFHSGAGLVPLAGPTAPQAPARP